MNTNVKISLEVTNTDGTPFCTNVLSYADVPRAGLLAIETEMVKLLAGLVELGKAELPTA